MKWLITGGSGQLGRALQKELISKKMDFVAANSLELDVTKELMVNQLVHHLKPSVIINTAAWTDVDAAEINQSAAYSVNVLGAQNLAIAASKIGARLVQLSTDYVFSGKNLVPWSEDAVHKPESIYGLTKSKSEKFILNEFPMQSYIVRTAWLYSANGKNFARTMVNLALKGRGVVKVVNDQQGQPTFADDLAKKIIELVLTDAPVGIYHGTNSNQATWFEFAQAIFQLTDADVSRLQPISTSEYPRLAKRPSYSVLGHDGWAKTTVPAMRDWRIALSEAMPAIISAVKTEE